MTQTKAKRNSGRNGGRKPTTIGGIPDPILVSERVAVELFAHVGMTREYLRKLIDSGTILRRKLTVNNREHTGLIYQELLIFAQQLPIAAPTE